MVNPDTHLVYQVRLKKAAPPSPEIQRFCRLHPNSDGTFFLSSSSFKVFETLNIPFKLLKKIPMDRSGIEVVVPLESSLYELPPENAKAEVIAWALAQAKNGHPPCVVYCGRTREEITGSFPLDIAGGRRNYRWRWAKKREELPLIERRFAKLIERMKDKDTRFVLSLGGGGLRLFAHSSMIRLVEALGAQKDVEEVWGCSGGAVAGLCHALGARAEEIEKLGYDIYNQRYSLILSPSKLRVLRNLFLDWLLPFRSDQLKGFVDIQHSLRNGVLRITKQHKPSLPFYAVAYNTDLKRNEVLTPMPAPASRYHGFIRQCSPMDAILASSAIPILFHPRTVPYRKTPYTYVDGSLTEEVPLISVYNKWVLDQKAKVTSKKKLFILAVNLFPHVSSWKPLGHFMLKHLPLIQYLSVAARLADLARQTRIDEQINTLRRDPDVEVAEIHLPLRDVSILDPKVIPTVIEKAHGSFLQQLMDIEDTL